MYIFINYIIIYFTAAQELACTRLPPKDLHAPPRPLNKHKRAVSRFVYPRRCVIYLRCIRYRCNSVPCDFDALTCSSPPSWPPFKIIARAWRHERRYTRSLAHSFIMNALSTHLRQQRALLSVCHLQCVTVHVIMLKYSLYCWIISNTRSWPTPEQFYYYLFKWRISSFRFREVNMCSYVHVMFPHSYST